MPVSASNQINQVVELITFLGPKRVLDIGVGFGKYGFLCREYLDVSNDAVKEYGHREIRIEGIEIYPKYITELQKQIYDQIHFGNALEILPGLKEKFDLIMIMDVIEHFTRADGIKLLKIALEKSNSVIISTPKILHEQGAVYGNINESHLYGWKEEDFRSVSDAFIYPHPEMLIVLLGKGVSELKEKYSAFMKLKISLSESMPFLRTVYRKISGKKN